MNRENKKTEFKTLFIEKIFPFLMCITMLSIVYLPHLLSIWLKWSNSALLFTGFWAGIPSVGFIGGMLWFGIWSIIDKVKTSRGNK